MTVTLNLKPEVEAESTQKAAPGGTALQQYIKTVITEAASRQPPPLSPEEQLAKNQAALELLKAWREEDISDDPAEIAREQAQWEEFKKHEREPFIQSDNLPMSAVVVLDSRQKTASEPKVQGRFSI